LKEESSDKRFMISFNPEEARWDIKEVESAGAAEAEGKTGPEHWPKMAQDSTHEHPLKLKKAVYNGIYRFEPRPPHLCCTTVLSSAHLSCAVLARVCSGATSACVRARAGSTTASRARSIFTPSAVTSTSALALLSNNP
jgi:hypothetical protein